MNISESSDEPDPECEQFENDYQLMVAQASQLIQLNDKPRVKWDITQNHSQNITHQKNLHVPFANSTIYYFLVKDLDKMSIEQRIKEVEKSKVCSNCLHPGHDYKSCRGGAYISQIAQQTCEEIFTSTTTRKDDGRFVVTIPFKQSPECLGQKWQSNDLEILQKANLLSNSLHSTINLGTKEPSKTLGIYWNTNQDTITYSTNIENSVSDNITKRKILSIIGQIFDPLGLISPSVLEAKIIMQKMWSLNLQWDNHVPHDIEVLWKKFIQSLSALKQLVIPRRVFYDSSKHIQLHIFCDASQNAYGGCVYVRSHTTKDEVYVQLLTAKCRVTPLKTLTIPRLELCAALTAVRLYKKVIDSLRNSHIISNCFFWSDSMIVLSWIKLSPYKLNAFTFSGMMTAAGLHHLGISAIILTCQKQNPRQTTQTLISVTHR
ncbi:hypothetical protein HF086_017245 [Spodoptera exigua]|uniref:Uncharacterized protein n=1 Tax=Spodoptera exigua TaxID=7107 RepID=A0A922MVI2_SPOEX|nr:hypothetical protein HF086_017245 [Spodoptera exigua]